MEYSDESRNTLPEYHSSLNLLQQLDDFWFYGSILKDNTRNPAINFPLLDIRPYRSIEMIEKKVFCGDGEEAAEGRGAITSSSALGFCLNAKFGAYLPCARFEPMITMSRDEWRIREEEHPIRIRSSSAETIATTAATTVQHCLDAPAMSQLEERETTTTTIIRRSDKASTRNTKQAHSYLAKEEQLASDIGTTNLVVKDKRKKSSKSMTSLEFNHELQASGFTCGNEDYGSYQGLRYCIPPEIMGQNTSLSSLHLLRWHVPITVEGTEDMKEHLKFWARAVASTVR